MKKIIILFWFLLLFLSACQSSQPEVPGAANAVYYWRTELSLDDEEREFLQSHEVKKMYLHLFDVVRRDGQLQPQATLEVTDTLPADIQVIPIVFMTHDVLKDTTGLGQLPHLIVQRVCQMMEQNGLGKPQEMQIDFDWTKRNARHYFPFLEKLKAETLQQGMQTLSATIRLHQLSLPAPPVDYGALMVYNVGNLQDPDEECSILTTQAVAPYMRYLADYPLPLCTALPAYSWDILFHDDGFQCILRGVNLNDTANFIRLDDSHYQALKYQIIPPNTVTQYSDGRIYPSDIVRHESVSFPTLQAVKQLLQAHRPSVTRQLILYHLDKQQLKAYSYDEIEKLYSDR